jgi:hypothetical protein
MAGSDGTSSTPPRNQVSWWKRPPTAPCRAGAEVIWRVYQGGHLWASGADHTDITQRTVGFVLRNPLPASAVK